MARNRIRIFFSNWVDADNFNAQSLNARELALRLNPEEFMCTLLYEKTPDARLVGREHVRLVKLPSRLGALTMLTQAVVGQDIIFRLNFDRFAELYVRVPKLLRRQKVVDWWEGYGAADDLRGEYTAEERRVSDLIEPHIDYRVAITETTAEVWKKQFGLNALTTIPVGVDTKQFRWVERHHTGALQVLCVGTLNPRKNQVEVLRAALCFPRARFVIVGKQQGTYFKHLEKLKRCLHLENVSFVNPVPHDALVELMGQCDVMLHPSKNEGMPKVVLEGAATGLPAVVFDFYRAPAVVHGETGYQVHTRQEMMARLGELLTDAARRERLGKQAAEHVKQFDWDIVAARWAEVFRQLAAS